MKLVSTERQFLSGTFQIDYLGDGSGYDSILPVGSTIQLATENGVLQITEEGFNIGQSGKDESHFLLEALLDDAGLVTTSTCFRLRLPSGRYVQAQDRGLFSGVMLHGPDQLFQFLYVRHRNGRPRFEGAVSGSRKTKKHLSEDMCQTITCPSVNDTIAAG